MQNQIAIQMDNIESIDYDFDTSFLIGYEAQLRNYKIFYYNPNNLIINNGTVQATGYYLKLNVNNFSVAFLTAVGLLITLVLLGSRSKIYVEVI